jgi:hypothetical protein
VKAKDFKALQDKVRATSGSPKIVDGVMKPPKLVYFGIDPGWTGALAVNTEDGCRVFKCPSTIADMHNLLGEILNENINKGYFLRGARFYAVVEQVHGRGYKDGKGEKWGAQNTFRFGMNCGAWEAILVANEIKPAFIKPQVWQKAMLGKVSTGKTKEASLRVAKQQYPELAGVIGKNHNFADAINLSMFCQGYFNGVIKRG